MTEKFYLIKKYRKGLRFGYGKIQKKNCRVTLVGLFEKVFFLLLLLLFLSRFFSLHIFHSFPCTCRNFLGNDVGHFQQMINSQQGVGFYSGLFLDQPPDCLEFLLAPNYIASNFFV